MELVELNPLKGGLVGLPGVDGLSTEQRKRLTIAVELVANPSIVFMDEPTSGLDARAAAIVMRTVRNIVNTGRTIVCTIHQPSIDIFESFDEVPLILILILIFIFTLLSNFTFNYQFCVVVVTDETWGEADLCWTFGDRVPQSYSVFSGWYFILFICKMAIF